MVNAIPYHEVGRSGQKARTRAAIVDAAVQLVERGEDATVEAAARAAGVGRGTAYRYFPNQGALLAAAHPLATAASMLPVHPPTEPAARLAIVVGEITRMTRATEPALRTMLRLSLDTEHEHADLPLRKGRRIVWVTEALAPLADHMPAERFGSLVLTIAATCGIEVLVWLTDVAGLDRDAAAETIGRIAETLLVGAMVGEGIGPKQ